MDKFLSDLNEILAGSFGFKSYDATVYGGALAYGAIGLIAFFLALFAIIRVLKGSSARIEVEQETNQQPPNDEIKIEIGEFGKIVSEKKMMIKGQELDYFIIKKSKYDKDTLPIGTIVVVIKKNSKEAYVKPADEKDVARLKGLL